MVLIQPCGQKKTNMFRNLQHKKAMKASDDWQHIKLQHRMFFVRLAVRVSQGDKSQACPAAGRI